MPTTHLDVVAAERMVFSGDVDMVLVPGAEGQLGILPRHAPLLTLLVPGEMRIRQEGDETVLAVGGGFLEAGPRQVTALVDSAERAEEIDVARAEAALRRARQRLRERAAETDLARAESALRRALARLRAVELARRRTSARIRRSGAPTSQG